MGEGWGRGGVGVIFHDGINRTVNRPEDSIVNEMYISCHML